MLALLDYESLQCRGCGGHLPDTTNPDNKFKATAPGRCHRCTAIHGMQLEYKDQKDLESLVIWPVEATN